MNQSSTSSVRENMQDPGGYAGGGPARPSGDKAYDEDLAKMRARIEETEAEMLGTLDAIEDKLSFDQLMKEAEETVLGAASGKMRQIAEGADEVIEKAGSFVADAFRNNPLPALLAGLGVGFLFMMRADSGQQETYRGKQMQEDRAGKAGKVGELLHQGLEREEQRAGGNDWLESERRYGRLTRSGQGKRGFWSVLEGNAVAFSIAALALGAAVGLGLPGRGGREKEVLDKMKGKDIEIPGQIGRKAGKMGDAAFEKTSTKPVEEAYESPYLTPEEARLAVEEGWHNYSV